APTNTEALPNVCGAAGVAFDGATAASCATAIASAAGSIVEIVTWFSTASHYFRQRRRCRAMKLPMLLGIVVEGRVG
ncbi:Hypothetical predicted protein, partial [Olea europaea subsp. europaea]